MRQPIQRFTQIVGILVVAGFLQARGTQVTLDAVQLKPEEVKPACEPLSGEFPVSLQAATLYRMDLLQQLGGPPPEKKALQSFKCGEKKATIYYYQYPAGTDMSKVLASTQALIWGEKHPSREHPEAILTIHNVLAVISTREPQSFEQLLAQRLKKNPDSK